MLALVVFMVTDVVPLVLMVVVGWVVVSEVTLAVMVKRAHHPKAIEVSPPK